MPDGGFVAHLAPSGDPCDTFSAEAGLTAAMLKKYMGNDNTFNKVINEWLARASYASVPALPEATE